VLFAAGYWGLYPEMAFQVKCFDGAQQLAVALVFAGSTLHLLQHAGTVSK
jgi:hypothetical protein